MTTAIRFRASTPFPLAGIALIPLLALAPGCASPGGGDASTAGYSSTFDRLLDKERKGEYADALKAYRSMARDTGRSFAERIRALVRAGRCLEERNQKLEARKAYEEVLRLPRLMADENHLPVEGEVDIHLRLQAEDGLTRVGGRPVRQYSTMARTGSPGEKRIAVRSIARLRDPGGRSALQTVLNDEKTDPALKEEAREALETLDRAENLKGKKK